MLFLFLLLPLLQATGYPCFTLFSQVKLSIPPISRVGPEAWGDLTEMVPQWNAGGTGDGGQDRAVTCVTWESVWKESLKLEQLGHLGPSLLQIWGIQGGNSTPVHPQPPLTAPVHSLNHACSLPGSEDGCGWSFRTQFPQDLPAGFNPKPMGPEVLSTWS